MIRHFVFVILSIASFNAFAEVSLVGEWQRGCQEINAADKVFVATTTAFKADGGFWIEKSYYKNDCTGSIFLSELKVKGGYRVKGKSLYQQYSYTPGKSVYETTSDYEINHDTLTITPASVKRDGYDQVVGDPYQLKRVPSMVPTRD